MITVRLLLSDLQGVLSEADTDIVMNNTFEQNVTDFILGCESLHIRVLRVELPSHIFTDCQSMLIPAADGTVTLDRRVPV